MTYIGKDASPEDWGLGDGEEKGSGRLGFVRERLGRVGRNR